MSWLAVDKDGYEYIYEQKPIRRDWFWDTTLPNKFVKLPKGSAKKLTGRDLTWDDDSVKIE